MTEPTALAPPAANERPALAGPPPTPIQKAAIILTALGPEMSAAVLKEVSPANLKRFATAVGSLDTVTQEMLDYVIVEFLEALAAGADLSGGADAARRLLSAVLDENDLEDMLNETVKIDGGTVWERLAAAPVAAVASYVGNEHPQVAAVILSELRPETAASILERVDRSFAREVVLRLSRAPTVDRRAGRAIASAIESDFLSALQRGLSRRRPAEMIAGLMNNISSEAREGFLAHLEESLPDVASAVQRSMFTFDHIATRLSPRDVATVVRDLPDEVLLPALKFGQMQGSDSVAAVLDNVPRRLAERYLEDLQTMPDLSRKDGESAHILVTKRVLELHKEGAIAFLDDRDDV